MTLRLYHFTCLYHLPPILREGLSKGEAVCSPWKVENAVSLTTNPDAEANRHWARGSCFDKLQVRIAIDLDEGDPHLETWRDFCRRKKVEKRWVRRLDPYGQGKFWRFYWGVVPADRLGVEVKEGAIYVPPADLAGLAARIDVERARFSDDGLFVHVPSDGSWLLGGEAS